MKKRNYYQDSSNDNRNRKPSNSHRGLFIFAVSISLTFSYISAPASNAMRTSIQNTSCQKLGEKKTYNYVSLLCQKVGTKLLWIANPVQKINPLIMSKKRVIQPVLAFTVEKNASPASGKEQDFDYVKASKDAFAWWENFSKGYVKFKPPIILQTVTSTNGKSCSPNKMGQGVITSLNLKNITDDSRLIIFAKDLTNCWSAGVAELGGRYVLINDAKLREGSENGQVDPLQVFQALIHELGHTFGLIHSGSVTCSMAEDSSAFVIDRKCVINEYGDFDDFMGAAAPATCRVDGSTNNVSLLQKYFVVGSPTPKLIDKPGDWNIGSPEGAANSLYYLPTKYGVAYIEFRSREQNACSYQSDGSFSSSSNDFRSDYTETEKYSLIAKPSVQIRLVGNDQARPVPRNQSDGISSIVLRRLMIRTYTEKNAQGGSLDLTWQGDDSNFYVGESIDIPNSPYTITVQEAQNTSADISVKARN